MRFITIIPAYNEENTIERVVKCAKEYSDVVVVDDGSNDQTSLLAGNAGAKIIKHPKNLGKGAAIKKGLEYAIKADFDLMILLDGDGQHDPQCIPFLVKGMTSADVIIGSRFINGIPPNMTMARRISNGITTRMIRYVTGYQITDSQCGFRVISKKAAPLFVEISYNDYVYESEFILISSENGLLVDERPIDCMYGDEKSYVRFKHVIHYIMFTIHLLLRKFYRRI